MSVLSKYKELFRSKRNPILDESKDSLSFESLDVPPALSAPTEIDDDLQPSFLDQLPAPVRSLIDKVLVNEDYDFVVYQIIPHVSALNSASRRFQSSLYELMNYKVGLFPWERGAKFFSSFSSDNLYLNISRNPSFWWMMCLEGLTPEQSSQVPTNEDGDFLLEDDFNGARTHRIAFYVAVPVDFADSFEIKFQNHLQWSKCTLKDLQLEESILKGYSYTPPPIDNTDMYLLKYKRHSMFSLEFDYKDQHLPIREMMGMVRELSPGEQLQFIVKTEAVPRKRWQGITDYTWKVWDRGDMPAKEGFDAQAVRDQLVKFGNHSITYTLNTVEDILRGIRGSFFSGSNEPMYREYNYVSSERQALLVNGDLSRRTKTKRFFPVFKTHIIVTVTSPDKVKRDMLGRSFANTMAELSGDNSLVLKKVKANIREELLRLRKFKTEFSNPNIMSVEEVGKLCQLPTSELQKEYEDALESNRRIERVLDKGLAEDHGLLAGTVTNRGEVFDVHIQRKNLDLASTTRIIVGSPRMGKDQHAINLVVEGRLKHKMGAIVLDVINEQNGHRGMADAIRDHIPAEHIIDLNLMDYANPIYLGLEPIVKLIDDPRIAADRVAEEVANFLLSEADADKLQTSEYLREASKLANADMLAIRHILTSKGYRDELRAKAPPTLDTDIWDDYDALSDKQQVGIYTPIMRRLGQIVNSEYLKPIFCQLPNPALDLYKLIDEGKVIIFRMKTGVMPRRVIEILCYWIVLVTFLIKLAQDGKSTNNEGTFLILNEPHQYMTKELAHFIQRIFAEGPKYRFVPTLIFHNFKQFREVPGFVDIMKSASVNWHLFKNTNEEIYKELFSYLSHTFETPQSAFEATKKYQFIGIWLNQDGEYYDPFVADSLPLVSDRYPTFDNSNLSKEHAKLYGRTIEEVLLTIRDRNKYAKSLANVGEDGEIEPPEDSEESPPPKNSKISKSNKPKSNVNKGKLTQNRIN